MKKLKYILLLLVSLLIISCDNPGVTRQKLDGNESDLPPELKGLKIYDVSTGFGDRIKVAVFDDSSTAIRIRKNKMWKNSVTIKTSLKPEQILFENDDILIIKK